MTRSAPKPSLLLARPGRAVHGAHKQWRQLQRQTGRREGFAESWVAIAELVKPALFDGQGCPNCYSGKVMTRSVVAKPSEVYSAIAVSLYAKTCSPIRTEPSSRARSAPASITARP